MLRRSPLKLFLKGEKIPAPPPPSPTPFPTTPVAILLSVFGLSYYFYKRKETNFLREAPFADIIETMNGGGLVFLQYQNGNEFDRAGEYIDPFDRHAVVLLTYIGPDRMEGLMLNKPIRDADFEKEVYSIFSSFLANRPSEHEDGNNSSNNPVDTSSSSLFFNRHTVHESAKESSFRACRLPESVHEKYHGATANIGEFPSRNFCANVVLCGGKEGLKNNELNVIHLGGQDVIGAVRLGKTDMYLNSKEPSLINDALTTTRAIHSPRIAAVFVGSTVVWDTKKFATDAETRKKWKFLVTDNYGGGLRFLARLNCDIARHKNDTGENMINFMTVPLLRDDYLHKALQEMDNKYHDEVRREDFNDRFAKTEQEKKFIHDHGIDVGKNNFIPWAMFGRRENDISERIWNDFERCSTTHPSVLNEEECLVTGLRKVML